MIIELGSSNDDAVVANSSRWWLLSGHRGLVGPEAETGAELSCWCQLSRTRDRTHCDEERIKTRVLQNDVYYSVDKYLINQTLVQELLCYQSEVVARILFRGRRFLRT